MHIDGHGWNSHWKVPCWQTLERQQGLSYSVLTCSHIGHAPPSLMATFCWENQVYSGQKNGWWIVKGRFIVHCAIRLSSTPSSLTVAWRTNGGMGEWLRSLWECFLSVALKLREEPYKELLCFSGHFLSRYRRKNYGYQIATLPLCSSQDLTDKCLWKIVKFIRELPSIDRYYWRMIAEVNTNLYGETE